MPRHRRPGPLDSSLVLAIALGVLAGLTMFSILLYLLVGAVADSLLFLRTS